VDYTVHVPRRAQVTHVNTVNGSLRVTDLDSVGDLRTVNGNIEVFEGSGNVHAHTYKWQCVSRTKAPGGFQRALRRPTNGSVAPGKFRRISPANLEAHCMNGNFSSGSFPWVMRGAVQPRVLHGKLGRGGTPIRLGTVNGPFVWLHFGATV